MGGVKGAGRRWRGTPKVVGNHHPRPEGTRGGKSLDTGGLGIGATLLKGDVGAMRMGGTSTQTPVPSSLPSSAGTSKGLYVASNQRARHPGGRGSRAQRGRGTRDGGWVTGPASVLALLPHCEIFGGFQKSVFPTVVCGIASHCVAGK